MPQITLIEAVTQALAYEMQHDDSVVVLGEDVGVNGGVFRATVGPAGKIRRACACIDTPLDETTIAGLTVGLAAQGMKPVAEAQFEGFIYPMMEQIACHAARMRTRTRGRMSVPGRVPRAVGRRHPRAGASLRGERASVHQHSRPARRAAVVARRAPTACCSPPSAIRIR